MVTWKGPKSFFPLSGQYCWHLILLPSFTLVTMTMVGGRSCQISRQKSTTVLGRGPVDKKGVLAIMCRKFNISIIVWLMSWLIQIVILVDFSINDSRFMQTYNAGPILNENGKVYLHVIHVYTASVAWKIKLKVCGYFKPNTQNIKATFITS